MNKFIIEKSILSGNIDIIKKLAGKSIIMAVIKCNGYGLGLIPYAKFLYENGITVFGVSTPEEAFELRKHFDCEIVLLTSVSNEFYVENIIKNNIIATVGSIKSAELLENAGKKLNIIPRAHIEINTGMGRCGFSPDSINNILKLSDKKIEFCGTFMHFSFSFSKKSKDITKPFEVFMNTVKKLNDKGFNTGVLHASNSTAFLDYPETHLDMVRVGSAFLGRVLAKNKYNLKKVGYLTSSIIETNLLKKGSNIGYGNTYRTKRDTVTAIVPIGYADGFMTEKAKDTYRFIDKLRYIYNDLFPGKLYVKSGNKNIPILGRTGMFNIICDITGTDLKAGDTIITSANPILLDSSVKREFI